MSAGQKKGARLAGSLAGPDDVRMRCVMGCDGCWSFRSARGARMPRTGQKVWVHGQGTMALLRAVWLLRTGRLPARGHVVYRTCGSYDCVAPEHLRSGTPRQARREAVRLGLYDTPARTAAQARAADARRRISDAQRAEIITSSLSGREVAALHGISQQRANALRAKARQALRVASVWDMGAAAMPRHQTER